jgi:hypothetical protein
MAVFGLSESQQCIGPLSEGLSLLFPEMLRSSGITLFPSLVASVSEFHLLQLSNVFLDKRPQTLIGLALRDVYLYPPKFCRLLFSGVLWRPLDDVYRLLVAFWFPQAKEMYRLRYN